jgi:hypothetical protein
MAVGESSCGQPLFGRPPPAMVITWEQRGTGPKANSDGKHANKSLLVGERVHDCDGREGRRTN